MILMTCFLRAARLAFPLAAALAAAGCGGGGAGPADAGKGADDAPAATVVTNLYARDTASAATYFWALGLKNAGTNPETAESYAVNYTGDPAGAGSVATTLYSGTLTLGTAGAASFAGKAMRADMSEADAAVSSTASFSRLLASSSLVEASFDVGRDQALVRSADAKTTVDQVAGRAWTGRWIDGPSTSAAQRVTVSAFGASGASASFDVLNCSGVRLQLTPTSAAGVYRASLDYTAQTGCRRSGTLSGLAAVQALPAGGYRLYLVATASGNGISFRGDSP